MKKIIIYLTLIFLIPIMSNSQEKFSYNENGLIPEYLVGDIENKSQNEIYQKSLNWIKETYKNPDEVIKTTIENEKVRFEGVEMDYLCEKVLASTFCYNTKYTIEIEFRDGKYKFTPLSMSYRQPPTTSAYASTSGGDVTIDLRNGSDFYNKRGALKKQTQSMPESIENLFNSLNERLMKYLNEDSSKKEW